MKCDRLVDVGRRQFLKTSVTGVVGVGVTRVTGAANLKENQPQNLARLNYPMTRLANIEDLAVNEPFNIFYPDAHSPGVLIKLGEKVPEGVGPDHDIVAFSVLCPHKGWWLHYNKQDKTLNCPGHFSRFDCESGGQQVWGHATQNLPQFKLRIDEQGDIHAQGVDELIFGRLSNILNT